jgi:hypothetical protein
MFIPWRIPLMVLRVSCVSSAIFPIRSYFTAEWIDVLRDPVAAVAEDGPQWLALGEFLDEFLADRGVEAGRERVAVHQ